MTDMTVKEATAVLVAKVDHVLASEAPVSSGLPDWDDAFTNVLKAPVKDFDDVRSLAWFAHQQMTLAFDSNDNMFCLIALQRAQAALSRVAHEMGVLYAPPSPSGVGKGMKQ